MNEQGKKLPDKEEVFDGSAYYEDQKYKIEFLDCNGTYKINDYDKYWGDFDHEEGELLWVQPSRIKITNKETGKSSTKTIYQDYLTREDFIRELDEKKMFPGIFKKIDP